MTEVVQDGVAAVSKPLALLLVEDSEQDAELLMLELRRGGFEPDFERVETAEDMREALARRTWDLIISDYALPRFSGPLALGIYAESGLDLPFIIVSGTIGEETAVAALHAGAGDFIVKGRFARLNTSIERELQKFAERAARRRAEQALRESEDRYRRIVETSNEGIALVSERYETLFANSRMAGLLGVQVGDLLGRSWLDFVHEASHELMIESLRGGPHAQSQFEARFKRSDGTDLWVLVDATRTVETSEQAGTALVMVMDVSQRKRLEEQLRQSQKMEAIGSLAGGIAHDFNNLLSVILSYTSLTLTELSAGDPLVADLSQIKLAGERAAALTRQLLAFSRQQVLTPKTLDLNQVLLGMETMLRRLLGEDLRLSLLTATKLGKVRADPGQIEQIIMNLAVNARDAMPSGGQMTIETSDVVLDSGYGGEHHEVLAGSYVMLAVTDTGTGMNAATQQRIFEPFFTTKPKGKGTGLGLSTVFGAVKQSGGHIWVYSELGRGTTFKLYFPRHTGPDEKVSVPPPAPASQRGSETILLVEDEQQVRGAMVTILRRHGYNVIEAENAGEAFLICEKFQARIDVLVTDVVMPRMSGRELVERLLPTRPGMKVLYVSGYTESAIVSHGILHSGVAFLSKPITPESLIQKLREVLDSPARDL